MEVLVSVEWAMGGLLLNFYATLPANKTNISLFYRLPKTYYQSSAGRNLEDNLLAPTCVGSLAIVLSFCHFSPHIC